jgi:hypothetical protein
MPDPTNLSALTASDVGTLSATISENIAIAGVSQTVWFSYTAVTDDQVFGVLAFAESGTAYRPKTTIWLGPASAPTQYLSSDLVAGHDVPMVVPVTSGTKYFIKVEPDAFSTNPPGANLALRVFKNPTSTAAAGSLFINDDTEFLKAVLLSPTTGAVLQYANTTVGEEGDVLPNGVIALSNDDALSEPDRIYIYSPALAQTSVTARGNNRPISIRGDATKFFFAEDVAGPTSNVRTIDTSGAIGGTTWSVTGSLFTIAPNRAGTILYWSDGGVGNPIHAYDLVGHAPLADLCAGVASHIVDKDLFVMEDGNILATYSDTGGNDYFCRTISPAGATIRSFAFTPAGTRTDGPRVCLGADDPASFWMWTTGTVGSDRVSRMKHFKTSDGTTIATFDVKVFESGLGPSGNGNDDAPPLPKFGNSKSCPILALRASIGPPTPPFVTTTYPVRRLRQSAHLSSEQMWQFFTMFQIDLETGMGLTDDADPQIMLSWSDDGGHTWSQEHWIGAGKTGQYTRRAIWRRLGRSRDRVWRVVVDAPVRWRLLQAFAQVQLGTS